MNWSTEIRNYLIKNNKSLWYLASYLGVTDRTVYNWIYENTMPNRKNQRALRQLLNYGNHGKINKVTEV